MFSCPGYPFPNNSVFRLLIQTIINTPPRSKRGKTNYSGRFRPPITSNRLALVVYRKRNTNNLKEGVMWQFSHEGRHVI